MQPEPQLVTGEAVAVDLPTAGIASRGLAAIVDLFTMYAALLLVTLLIAALGSSTDPATWVTVLLVAYVGVLLGYPVGMETLWRGRTLGKALMGLRVVRDDGGPIRFRHAFVRGLLGLFFERPGITVGLAALLPMLFTRSSKRCGDLLAGTIVVRDRVAVRMDRPVVMPAPLASWASALDLSGVSDELSGRARAYLARAASLSPGARQGFESALAGEITALVGPPPSDAPSWAVIAAVVAERRERALRSASAPVPATASDTLPATEPADNHPPPTSSTGFAPPA